MTGILLVVLPAATAATAFRVVVPSASVQLVLGMLAWSGVAATGALLATAAFAAGDSALAVAMAPVGQAAALALVLGFTG